MFFASFAVFGVFTRSAYLGLLSLELHDNTLGDFIFRSNCSFNFQTSLKP